MGGGRGLEATGTHPIADARAKGNQAATDAITVPLLDDKDSSCGMKTILDFLICYCIRRGHADNDPIRE
jgi:hypothetical protein